MEQMMLKAVREKVFWCVIGLGGLGACFAAPIPAQETAPAAASSAPQQPLVQADQEDSPAGVSDEKRPELSEEEIHKRKQMLSLSWIMLVGIGLLGAMMILIALFLGFQVRRRVRRPLPKAPLRDPFWYLKSPESSGTPPEPRLPPDSDSSAENSQK